MFEHNIEFLLRKRKWRLEGQPIRKFIFRNEWRRTKKVEAEVCQSFDHVIVVSQKDYDTAHQEFGVNRISVLPTGVDFEFFRPIDKSSTPGRLVFVGSMDWAPNEDGIVWFIREVYPQVRRQVPRATLTIVGRNPSSKVRALAAEDSSLKVTGWVSDVRPYIAEAEVVIVPLRFGGGTRIKIPEAMAMNKAVVSTPIGAEGLPFGNRREIRVAEGSKEFGQAIVELLQNNLLRDSIATAARERVVKDHSWETVADKFHQVLERVQRSGIRATAA